MEGHFIIASALPKQHCTHFMCMTSIRGGSFFIYVVLLLHIAKKLCYHIKRESNIMEARMQEVKSRLLKIASELSAKEKEINTHACFFIMDVVSLAYALSEERMRKLIQETVTKEGDTFRICALAVPAYPEWYLSLLKEKLENVKYAPVHIISHLTHGAEKDKAYLHPMEIPQPYNRQLKTVECALMFKTRPLERFCEEYKINKYYWYNQSLHNMVGAGVVTLTGKHIYLAEREGDKGFMFSETLQIEGEDTFLKHAENICVGCINGGSMYWKSIEKNFPEVYTAMALLETKGEGYLSKRWDDWVGIREFLEGDFLPEYSRGHCPLGRGSCGGIMQRDKKLVRQQ